MQIPYGKQWVTDEEIEKIVEVLKSDYLTTGPYVKEFENKFAKFVGVKYAVAVSSGTAALHLSVLVNEIKKGDEVITTPMTFAASSNCVLYSSGKPVFSDIDERGLIDSNFISDKISEKTVGLIPVDYMGLPCNWDAIASIAKENNLFIIEDSCHALGAKYKGNKIGSCKYSDLSVFSFHPVKHITTGEGGIITTNNKQLSKKLSKLRSHGITKNSTEYKTNIRDPWYHEMQYLGYNYRLTDIQAVLGISQLERIEEFIKTRRSIAKEYSDLFDNLSVDVDIIHEKEYEYHSYHLFIIKLKNAKKRLDFYNYLHQKNIYCQIHYIPVYWHPHYQKLGYQKGLCKKAEQFYERIISLPMYPAIQTEEMLYIKETIKQFFKTP